MNELLNTPLSERELEILRLVAQGKANKEIASELFISVNTVKVHLAKIFHRIGVASRTEATLYAIEHEHVENPNHSLVNPQDQQVESRVELVVPETVTVERAIVKLSPGEIIRKFWWAFGLGLLVLTSFMVAWDRGWIFPKPTPDPILAAMNEDRWKELTPMSVARANMAVTVYDNKIYVIGGETEEGVTGLTEVYDIATDTWAKLPDKPTPVTNAKAVVVGGKIYVPGGRGETHKSTNVVEQFDPTLNAWQTEEKLPEPTSEYALAANEGKIYLFGGQNNEKTARAVFSFDPDTKFWTKETELPTLMSDVKATSFGNDIIIISGADKSAENLPIWSFTPNRRNELLTWKVVGELPFPCSPCYVNSILDSLYLINPNGIWQQQKATGDWLLMSPSSPSYDLTKINATANSSTNIFIFSNSPQSNIGDKLYSVKVLYTISFPGIIKP
jgi:DNA-binding CsgD family transcriptional regulator